MGSFDDHAIDNRGTSGGAAAAVVGTLLRRSWVLALGVLVLCLLIPWLGISPTWVRIAALTAIFSLVVSGLNLTWGYAGELSLGQVAVFAVGAYVSAYMSLHGVTDMLAQLAAAGAAGATVGLVVGLPGLRVSGLSFAMTSFFLVLLIPPITTLTQSITGGFTGLYGVPDMTFAGQPVTGDFYVVVCVLVAGLWIAFVRQLVLSEYGRSFSVLRESPVLAESLGIPVVRQKVKTYVFGSIPAAFAGCLFTHLDGFVAPSNFGFSIAVGLIAASVIGGIRTIYGAVIGAFLLQLGPYLTSSFTGYSLVIYGGLLLIAAILTTGGLAAIAAQLTGRMLSLVAPGSAPPPPSTTAPAPVRAGSAPRRDATVRVVGISRSFGGVRALDDVSLTIEPGLVTALIGPNGSGKTTLLNILSGHYGADSGRIDIAGKRLDGRSAHRCYTLGVSRTFQTPKIPALTTVDVIATGRWSADPVGILPSVLGTPRARRAQAAHRGAALAFLEELGLGELAWRDASSLPLGQRRLIEVGRAALAHPRLLLLDEPDSGLSTAETAQLRTILERFKGTDVAVLLVEHNVEFVTTVADYVYVLDSGRLIASGPPAEVMRDPAVISSYTGKVH